MPEPEEADDRSPIADLHCHYPMKFLADDRDNNRVRKDLGDKADEPTNLTLQYVVRVRKQPGIWPKIRACLVWIAARLKNHAGWDEVWRVDLDLLKKGAVRIVFSVGFLPWTEISDPDEDGDIGELTTLLDDVRASVDADADSQFVESEADLDEALRENRLAFVHCIEGGMHLGRSATQMDGRVKALADKGVVYITLAHLFPRGIATNAPAIPGLSDRCYHFIFRQPSTKYPDDGLSAEGEAAVRAMHKHGVLIDVSHMRQDALDETFRLLEEELDKGRDPKDYPVIATHAGYRFGDDGLEYMLSEDTIGKIAARDGVVGLIMAQHQLRHNTGVTDNAFSGTVKTVRMHIDAIDAAAKKAVADAKPNAHVGIGSDLDGFIKPTMAGIDYVNELDRLRDPLIQAYGDEAHDILGGNAERVLRAALRART